ncbi:MAG: hypothetical protein FWG73_05770 [Planctomycetaceae bacterium]|nr:hypothetical protein [Planctomycetaceae bacterium]
MRTHYTFIFTVLTALFLVSGTSGCKSNGGAWYNPTSYSISNPFSKDTYAKDNLAPLFNSSDNLANAKPSLNAQANIDTPHGGYSNRTADTGSGTASLTPLDHWGHGTNAHQGQMTAQQSMQGTVASSMHGSGLPGLQNNQFIAEHPQHSPHGDMYSAHQQHQGSFGGMHSPVQQAQMPHSQMPGHTQGHNTMQYQPEFAQQADPSMPFPYHPTAFHPQTNAMNAGTMGQPGQTVPHGSPFGAVPPQADPFAVAQHPPGFGHPPMAPAQPQPYQDIPPQVPQQAFGAGDGFSTPSPYQPYSLPSSGQYGF